MNWLFWKEYRQNRLIVFTMLFLLILPHLCGLYALCMVFRLPHPDAFAWMDILIAASLYSFAISQVALALIGGNAIAGERVDRSAEFQAYLPITRKKIIAAKILLVLAIAAVIWLTNPPFVWCVLHLTDNTAYRINAPFILGGFTNIALTGLTFFCVAWLLSSILTSPTISVVGGLITPLIIWSVILYITYLILGDRWTPQTWEITEYTYRGLCLTLSPLCFGIGTWLYLRRVEP
jgi:ABC-type transport system involved in multi-copper enzyme maturation permease subunit